ncbi:MAG: site-specific DNA-methyltransferase [Chloroflexi bacterium]|nr:site-specific DNA-methyltransferase [Chloroflexota bacterium]
MNSDYLQTSDGESIDTDEYSVDLTEDKELKESSVHQLHLLPEYPDIHLNDGSMKDRLVQVLSDDLSFHGQDTSYASHNYHAFPAKFPPQLPRKFIHFLTEPGDVVLDPMMGSGTTIVEAYLADRQAIGGDIDPLARLLTAVKTTPLDIENVFDANNSILKGANYLLTYDQDKLNTVLESRWDKQVQRFIDFWFAQETQFELAALLIAIENVSDESLRAFFEVAFSACIITKSGGVSLALDLAHTRPHRAKVAYSPDKNILFGEELLKHPTSRLRYITKHLRSPLTEFQKRVHKNARSLIELEVHSKPPILTEMDAHSLNMKNDSVDLIVTSPPYASNAIDYMRAHKFSLVWLGYGLDQLGRTRRECIGGESTTGFTFEILPIFTANKVAEVGDVDTKKGNVLRRYYSEMTRVLREMYRVLKPGRYALLVVATSYMRQIDTETHKCLAEIGQSIGFDEPHTGVRYLDRNRRMLPAGTTINLDSQIQNRMHVEYVLGFRKGDPT